MQKNKTVVNADKIQKALDNIADKILQSAGVIENIILIGIHTRGVFLAERLGNILEKLTGSRVLTGEIDINLYRDDQTTITRQPVVKSTKIPFSIDGKIVVLVDDVLFTGRTIRAAMDAIIDFGRPGRIGLAVLVDRGNREFPIQADFIGVVLKAELNERVNVLLKECDKEDKVVIEKES